MDQFVEALPLLIEAVAGLTAQLGSRHLDTLMMKGNLARLLQKTEEQAEARLLLEEVMAGQTEQLGPAHTSTLLTKMNLASLLHEMGQRMEAWQLFEEALVAQLGGGHVATLRTKANLALRLKDMGKLDEALPLQEEAAAGLRSQLGPMHPHAQHAAGSLRLLRQRLAVTTGTPTPISEADAGRGVGADWSSSRVVRTAARASPQWACVAAISAAPPLPLLPVYHGVMVPADWERKEGRGEAEKRGEGRGGAEKRGKGRRERGERIFAD